MKLGLHIPADKALRFFFFRHTFLSIEEKVSRLNVFFKFFRYFAPHRVRVSSVPFHVSEYIKLKCPIQIT